MSQDTQNRRVRDDRRKRGPSPGQNRYGRFRYVRAGNCRPRIDGLQSPESGLVASQGELASALTVVAAIVGVAVVVALEVVE